MLPDAEEFLTPQNHLAQTWEILLMGNAPYQNGQQK